MCTLKKKKKQNWNLFTHRFSVCVGPTSADSQQYFNIIIAHLAED